MKIGMGMDRIAGAGAARRTLVLACRSTLLLAALSLAACNSGSLSEGLGSARVSNTTTSSPQPAQGVGGQTALLAEPSSGSNQQVASLGPTSPVAFLPVTGAPQSAVTSLAGAMRSSAQANQVPVVVSVEQGARFQVKGYFSALNDGSGTILVYVWDVLDANGSRVHRISGQERGPAAAGDPWVAINEDMLKRVSDTTMASLRTWLSTRNAG
ncbi:MAG: hypothetical protein WBO55_03995 [Rhizobiaceae bacterium]